ncbi:MAG: 4Fe-4S binding protein [Eubacterium sp.]
MVRRIIQIDEDKCNGCGACASACHEGAIGIIDGKAKLLRDDYCDGLGDCLPTCPTGAIQFVEREAAAYDEEAVKENMKKRAMLENRGETGTVAARSSGGCPGSRMRTLRQQREEINALDNISEKVPVSQLAQWPCQIKLVPTNAPYFDGAKLLIAADCTAYAYANMHQEFMRGKVTIIGCPKLDDIDYSEKLTTIIRNNDIKEVTIVRMEVPCCGGLEMAAKKAIRESGKFIPWQIVTISIDGKKLD